MQCLLISLYIIITITVVVFFEVVDKFLKVFFFIVLFAGSLLTTMMARFLQEIKKGFNVVQFQELLG